MFTDLLDLPIDRDRAHQQDQILTLSGMTWADYEQLVSEDYLGYRVSYWQGNITIVSLSRNHKRIAETINGLVKTYCRKHNLVYFPIGSTTLKNPPLAGKEPDCSFAFHADKSIPDLAVEVTYLSGGTVDLEKYHYLGVKEVWFWQNNEITFYSLVDSDYVEISQSFCLSQLAANFLLGFVNRGLTESPLTIEADFYRAV
ncbi:MAG: Uma2 family endonuclease [Cyanobacteria bacterium P01_H01_bin.119]